MSNDSVPSSVELDKLIIHSVSNEIPAITAPIPVANKAVLNNFIAPVEVPTATAYTFCAVVSNPVFAVASPIINAESFCKELAIC